MRMLQDPSPPALSGTRGSERCSAIVIAKCASPAPPPSSQHAERHEHRRDRKKPDGDKEQIALNRKDFRQHVSVSSTFFAVGHRRLARAGL